MSFQAAVLGLGRLLMFEKSIEKAFKSKITVLENVKRMDRTLFWVQKKPDFFEAKNKDSFLIEVSSAISAFCALYFVCHGCLHCK